MFSTIILSYYKRFFKWFCHYIKVFTIYSKSVYRESRSKIIFPRQNSLLRFNIILSQIYTSVLCPNKIKSNPVFASGCFILQIFIYKSGAFYKKGSRAPLCSCFNADAFSSLNLYSKPANYRLIKDEELAP